VAGRQTGSVIKVFGGNEPSCEVVVSNKLEGDGVASLVMVKYY
jgi:hypothetical protein